MDIKINKVGLIKEGLDKGWYVRIVEDFQNTGGYLIYTFNSLDSNDPKFLIYDSWVENLEDLKIYFDESSWCVEWLQEQDLMS